MYTPLNSARAPNGSQFFVS